MIQVPNWSAKPFVQEQPRLQSSTKSREFGGTNPNVQQPQQSSPFSTEWMRFFTELSTMVQSGMIVRWGGSGSQVPSGWLVCDNAIYDISRYQTLFQTIGSTYGGDGVTTFAVPPATPGIVEMIKV